MRLRGSGLWLAFLSVLVFAACGQEQRRPSAEDTFPAPNGPLLGASAMVLESDKHPPELCLGGVQLSLPPQCGGPRLIGWDWDLVDDEERSGRTIWGQYHVVGNYDGDSFTLTQRPGPPEKGDTYVPPGPSCPKPSGGWPRSLDSTDQDITRVGEATSKEPDFAGLWLSYQGTPRPEYLDPRRATTGDDPATAIINVAFTGDLETHRAEIRKIWAGGLCVVKRDRTLAELHRIASEAFTFAKGLGLNPYASAPSVAKGIAVISVYFADADDQRRFDVRFGKGVVELDSVLKPVS